MGSKRREKRSKKPEEPSPTTEISSAARNVSDTPPLVKWPKPKKPGPRSRYSE